MNQRFEYRKSKKKVLNNFFKHRHLTRFYSTKPLVNKPDYVITYTTAIMDHAKHNYVMTKFICAEYYLNRYQYLDNIKKI